MIEMPAIWLYETGDRRAALGFYAVALSDGSLQLLDYLDGSFTMSVDAFWSLVEKMEAEGLRADAPEPVPVVEPARARQPKGTVWSDIILALRGQEA